MAWFEDLAECTYFPIPTAGVRAVGWLERGKPYPSGAVDPRVYTALQRLRERPWQPFIAMGLHLCDLCLYDGVPGSANLFIPGTGVIYICPELITHYMNAHAYQPPAEFCDAVLACPRMSSAAYFKAVRANGGRDLVILQKS